MSILSAGVVVTQGKGDKRVYLILRAYQNWDFPKGLVEPGEDPLQAAIREVEEETSLTDLQFEWGYDYRETEPYGRDKVARYYLAETHALTIELPVSPELGKPEHDEYRWVDYKTARNMLPARLQPVLAWAEKILSRKD